MKSSNRTHSRKHHHKPLSPWQLAVHITLALSLVFNVAAPIGSVAHAMKPMPVEPPPVEPPVEVPEPPPSLKGVTPPPVRDRITDLSLVPHFVEDEDAAIELGKALFWDMQAGSDGQACASCHFHAGVDNRVKNQLSPAFLDGGNNMFDTTGSGGAGGPNYTLVEADFPFHRLADPSDRDSEVEFDTDDVASSQGVFGTVFNDILVGTTEMFQAPDDCNIAGGGDGDPAGFHVSGINTRRVEPRHTPGVINAALNFRNFWDGRANNIFNGVDPFGRRNEGARILAINSDGDVEKIKVELENSSLASQAVGPPLSDFEMSCANRTFPKLGKKLLHLRPLGLQNVSTSDSVLGGIANIVGPNPRGLTLRYADMIMDAFPERFWDSDELFDGNGNPLGVSGIPINTDQFTMMEINFSYFWGLAVQLYENTLISDDSPFDNDELSDEAQKGLDVFLNDGKCINCHATSMFTKASTLHLVDEAEEEGLVERMLMNGQNFHYSLLGSGTLKRGWGKKFHVEFDFDAEGTPEAVGEDSDAYIAPGLAPDAAGGVIHLSVHKKKSVSCDYAVDSFTLDPDGRKRTVDAGVTALLIETEEPALEAKECPKSIVVRVIDNVKLRRRTCDLVTIAAIDEDSDSKKGDSDSGSDSDSDSDSGHKLLGKRCIGKNSLRVLPPAIYDNGFYNIGVRPTEEDLAVGGKDQWGNPLSFSRQYKNMLRGRDVPDPFEIDECTFEIRFDPILDAPFFPGGFDEVECEDGTTTVRPTNNASNQKGLRTMRVAVNGAFKVATIRNVEITGPFFHNGGEAFLRQVVEFYNRGGNFADNNRLDLDPDITSLELSEEQKDALVAFMKSLTDDRVRCEEAPFDHPQLFVPNGHPGDETTVMDDGTGQATDELLEIGAVGAAGRDDCVGANELEPFLGGGD